MADGGVADASPSHSSQRLTERDDEEVRGCHGMQSDLAAGTKKLHGRAAVVACARPVRPPARIGALPMAAIFERASRCERAADSWLL